jgi:phospholipid/cholesterol/gamma-HCH transport system permease protein
VANLVAVSVTRELGPLLTAIIIAGRSGSGIAAEIGTMKVAEEIDALRTMGLNPINFLVVPRAVAMVVVLPCLTLLADLVGIIGGYLIAVTTLDISPIRFYNQTANALVIKDLVTGLVKSVFFAMIIAAIGCYQGFIVEGGAEGVGKSTTASVFYRAVLFDVLKTWLLFAPVVVMFPTIRIATFERCAANSGFLGMNLLMRVLWLS